MALRFRRSVAGRRPRPRPPARSHRDDRRDQTFQCLHCALDASRRCGVDRLVDIEFRDMISRPSACTGWRRSWLAAARNWVLIWVANSVPTRQSTLATCGRSIQSQNRGGPLREDLHASQCGYRGRSTSACPSSRSVFNSQCREDLPVEFALIGNLAVAKFIVAAESIASDQSCPAGPLFDRRPIATNDTAYRRYFRQTRRPILWREARAAGRCLVLL